MIPALGVEEFPGFFREVHGVEPFAWQAELASAVLSGASWPEAVDVPTGMGKTALLDVAVFSLAAQADLPADRRNAPTRTMIIVDRRVIVDQTFRRARKLADALLRPAGGIAGRVATRLEALSDGGPPLDVVRMRGGTTWSWRWLRSPDQPAVVVGTVDQLGSRVLFRGYGVGSTLRPIDAALCGTDCLVILDEAHLARALVETLGSVHEYESSAERPLLIRRHPRPVVMSATLGSRQAGTYRFDPQREASEEAQRRINAARNVATVEMSSSARDPVPDLAKALAGIVVEHLTVGRPERVAVVCNTVGLARSVHGLLDGSIDADVCLLTGRCREFDRARLAAEWNPRLEAAHPRTPQERPLVAVATQTIEVGADFDFDLLVTEAAPVDALVQRLGRLNRLGRRGEAQAVVVHCDRRHASDPVYGPATDLTWHWLCAITGDTPQARPKDVPGAALAATSADLGPRRLRAFLDQAGPELASDPPVVPAVLGPLIAAWARTSPNPEPDQVVAPFLHGIDRNIPQVQVCWRAGLPEPHDPAARSAWSDEVKAVPVSARETVEVPLWEARRFLDGRSGGHLPDIEGAGAEDDPFDEAVPVHSWLLRDGEVLLARSGRLKPGDTLLVRAEEGGHDEWGWTGERGRPVTDVADLCQRVPTLRLRPGLLANTIGGSFEDWKDRLATGFGAEDDRAAAEVVARQLGVVAGVSLGAVASSVGTMVRATGGLLSQFPLVFEQRARRSATVRDQPAARGYVVAAPAGTPWSGLPEWAAPSRSGDDGQPRGAVLDIDSDEDDASSSLAPAGITLDRHLEDVGRRAASIGRRMGLPDDLVRVVELAGLAHDMGKADPRFQVILHGSPLRFEASGEVLAKSGVTSGSGSPGSRSEGYMASGWPRGMRHEELSAVAISQVLVAEPAYFEGLDVELLVHLVASHHGRARPLFPPVADPEPETVRARLPGPGFEAVLQPRPREFDWDGPARFERLGHRYGWWGLALLEAVVRLADIACSEEYSAVGT